MAEPSSAGVGPGPGQQQVFRGRATVQPRGRPRLSDTADLPVIEPTPTPEQGPGRGPASARRNAVPAGPPRGMVVRRRWRRLRAGAGWTWGGLTFVLVCWGIWAVSVRGTDVVGPVVGLVLVLACGALMFVIAQLLGRAVLERALRRDRLSAWPSHLAVCGFLTLAGLAFLQQTWWIRDAGRWLGDSWQRLGDTWQWFVDRWPL